MDSMYQAPFQTAFKDDELIWSAAASSSSTSTAPTSTSSTAASSSTIQPQACWSQADVMISNTSSSSNSHPFPYPLQHQIFPSVESHQHQHHHHQHHHHPHSNHHQHQHQHHQSHNHSHHSHHHQFMPPFVAHAFTPGASPLLNTDNSPYLPTLYPVKPEQAAHERIFTSEPETNVRHAPFPTPDPSPQLTPSPYLKASQDPAGSINALMKEIQARSKEPQSPPNNRAGSSPAGSGDLPSGSPSHQGSSTVKEKKHACPHSDCGKTFSQKTHLDIHLRSHSGVKPFACPYPPCPSRFTQLGNLKTHVRRHTGEKPFTCDLCPKRFAQRGNVRSHRATVHANRDEKRMFECRLDGCGKFFSQRGNLKGHMERFHAEAISELTQRFSKIQASDVSQELSPEDQDLWEYLRDMYKYSNQGIKGRGKDRKVMAINPAGGLHSLPPPLNIGQGSIGSGRSSANASMSPYSVSGP